MRWERKAKRVFVVVFEVVYHVVKLFLAETGLELKMTLTSPSNIIFSFSFSFFIPGNDHQPLGQQRGSI